MASAVLYGPLFLQLPADLVLYLCREHLRPASAAALSLTCKSLFVLVFAGTRPGFNGGTQRRDLQLLLEKDLGHAPLPRRRVLLGSGFSIGYRSVRLAMNRHFLGAPNGLPLRYFDVQGISLGPLRWFEKWSARILQGELFLSARRTMCGSAWTDEALRAALDHEGPRYDICGHVSMSGPWSISNVTALHSAAVSASTSARAPVVLVPCRDLVEACGRCLTDYTTTVERRVRPVQGGGVDGRQTMEYWFITITSFHRLGSGRSPWDAKWQAFGGRPSISTIRLRRDMETHPPGAVKAAWDEGEQAAVSGHRRSHSSPTWRAC
ncbi:hypothetical protein C8A05DRAFT_46026 [Staphylotrichum tortipilum]|uniref:F-box domain-containing protein n=1 Tax=Staphylotrichum tortipilum TaxID=2831512 RepID=A0AAN6MFT4_9PEZI|nr:hypothetical protein C8A05DRAFT_46026 [Staphylotrichum longicolle]